MYTYILDLLVHRESTVLYLLWVRYECGVVYVEGEGGGRVYGKKVKSVTNSSPDIKGLAAT